MKTNRVFLIILAIFICLVPFYLYFDFLLSIFSVSYISKLGINYNHYRTGMSMSTNNRSRHVAMILTREPSHKVINHLSALLSVGVDAFVMCDIPPKNLSTLSSMDLVNRIVYVNDTDLVRLGLGENRVWDRTFVWLYNKVNIDYVWVMEDDVTWVHINDMLDLFNQYAKNRADLLSRNIIYRTNDSDWMWWPKIPLDLFPQHKWAGSLNMLARISRRLIDAHQKYTRQLYTRSKKIENDGDYRYQEFFIPTVAHMQKLAMAIYNHSKMNVHVDSLNESDIRSSLAEGKRIFHPVKYDSEVLANIRRNRH